MLLRIFLAVQLGFTITLSAAIRVPALSRMLLSKHRIMSAFRNIASICKTGLGSKIQKA